MAQPIPDTSFTLATSKLNATMEYVPNLMPFHMEYNGPAPVSTYMKVEVEKRGVGMPLGGEEGEGEDKVKTGEAGVVDADMKLCEAKVEASGQGDWKEGRYVSTFRGRLIHGLDVRLPGGYSGLVLRSEGGSSKEASKGEGKANRRRRRRSDARSGMSAEEDEDENEDEDDEEDERDRETVLVPSGMFSNVRVWEADMPVDGGRDEYIRSLREWSVLCGEIHRV